MKEALMRSAAFHVTVEMIKFATILMVVVHLVYVHLDGKDLIAVQVSKLLMLCSILNRNSNSSLLNDSIRTISYHTNN